MEEKQNSIIQRALEIFTEKYHPAQRIHEATDFLSTAHIKKAILEVDNSIKITDAEIVSFLVEKGYNLDAEPGKINFNLRWLLIKKY